MLSIDAFKLDQAVLSQKLKLFHDFISWRGAQAIRHDWPLRIKWVR